jgi:sulfur relay (sulfurtransferase) complex TusBCD TusD component (DsrE family)
MAKYLMIANAGPEDANRATVPFLTAKALIENGEDNDEVTVWLYNNAVYLMRTGCWENVQAPGLPPLEDLMLYLTQVKPIPIYIGVSCAIGRGLVDQDHKPVCGFSYGELGDPSKLATLIREADHVVGF